MRFQRPADNLATECVQDDSEIAELLRQMHVGDISHPELIEAGEQYTAGKGWERRTRCDANSSLSAQTGSDAGTKGCPRASSAAPACDWLASLHASGEPRSVGSRSGDA